MAKEYLGYVRTNDPLFEYLKYDIQPQIADFCDDPAYKVFRLNASNAVYLYDEETTGAKIIGKYFFSEREENPENAERRLEREYGRLEEVRGYGFDQPPLYVAKPLGRNHDLGDLLTVEFCDGELFSSIISRAVVEHDDETLYDCLGLLAYFFAELHNRTAIGSERVDFDGFCAYTDQVIAQCAPLLNDGETEMFRRLSDQWRERPEMWSDCPVLVHGDATPDNFIFSFDSLKTFDLERCANADRVFDIGRMAGELKHFFSMNAGDEFAAEPFISHFLREYASHFPDADAAFESITKRVPFYMGTTLLRIARNFWIDRDYRRRLVFEAEECFKEGAV